MSSRITDIPGTHTMVVYLGAVAATSATQVRPLMEAPVDIVVETVTLLPGAAVTGDDTNTININILDGGAAGTGTTEIGNVDLVADVDLAIGTPVDIDCDEAELDAGDVLTVQVAKVGTGGTYTGGFQITYRYQ